MTFDPPISSLEQAQDIMRSSGRYSLAPELWRDVRVAIFPHLQRNADPLIDVSGGGFDLDLDATNPPSWVSSDFGPVLSFDGTDDEASIPASASLGNESNFSITVTFKTTDTQGAFYGEGSTSDAAPFLIVDVSTGSGLIRILHESDDFTVLQLFGSASADGRRHVVTATRDGSTFRLFRDGVPDGTASAPVDATTIDDIKLGLVNNGGTKALYLNGEIGCCVTHARTLAPQEVQQLHRDLFVMLRPRRRKVFWAPISPGGLLKSPGMTGGMQELTGGMSA